MHSKTVDYSADLYGKVMDNMADYHQTGETVCGAQDPAVITLREPVAGVEGFTVVRVTERYVSPWQSDTFLEFSNDELTAEEYDRYDRIMDEYGA
jgi:hypothetical protein